MSGQASITPAKYKITASSQEWVSSFNSWRHHGAIPEFFDTPEPIADNSIVEEKNWLAYAQAFDWFNTNVAMEPALLLHLIGETIDPGKVTGDQ